MTLSILIADDHAVCKALSVVLRPRRDMRVVAEARTGREAVALARTLVPSVVLLDVFRSELSGPEAAQQIARECPLTRIIALSVHSDRRFVSGMLRAGAAGYVLKSRAFEELAAAIEAVCRGESYLDSSIPIDALGPR